MTLFFTVTTLQQLPQALALGESLRQHQPADRFVIGLADDSGQIPATFQCPYELIPVTALPVDLPLLSEKYNPAEFAAAVKPLFLQHLWQTRPEAEQVIYLAPSIFLYRPLTELPALFADSPLLLTPQCWQQIEAGVLQRVELLERILDDVYGKQELLAANLLPPALVQGHPGYLRAMHGVRPAGGRRLHIVAFDLARVGRDPAHAGPLGPGVPAGEPADHLAPVPLGLPRPQRAAAGRHLPGAAGKHDGHVPNGGR